MSIRVEPCSDCGTEPESAYVFVGDGWYYDYRNETWHCIECVKDSVVYEAITELEKEIMTMLPASVNEYAAGIRDGLFRSRDAACRRRKAINESHSIRANRA